MKRYNLEEYVLPVWEGNTTFYETGMFLGEEGTCSLLYTPKKILGVYNYGLEIEYQEGVDYIVEGKKIRRLPRSSMPYAKIEDIYTSQPQVCKIVVDKNRCPDYEVGREYMTFGETDSYSKFQFAISYIHDDEWKGSIPLSKAQRFPNVHAKLKQKQPLHITVYGDSICTGCNSSGTEFGGFVPPYADSFPVMIQKQLAKIYETEVCLSNVAVGGWKTETGLNAFKERVLAEKSDLLVLGFGMNDGVTPLSDYKEMIEKMVKGFRDENPLGEVVLIAPMLPNVETDWLRNQPLFAKELYELEKKYSFVAVADMTRMHQDLLNNGKRYRDMSGNNINHPNDFLARIYAQVILQTIG